MCKYMAYILSNGFTYKKYWLKIERNDPPGYEKCFVTFYIFC